jgi:cation diffusion facilitator CzcD-associated flavoprotein CzcO
LEREHLDVLIVGAGLSGIGAACHLSARCPGKSFAVLEARDRSGGTWDLFRYPGIRSDSDMFTLGYSFKPWEDPKALADGPSILAYVRETAREHGVEQRIRYNRRVVAAAWSSEQARWTVTVQDTETGASEQLTCSFLYSNTGYYRYDEGYSPEFPGAERFRGQIVHPQHWPEELDHGGKRMLVIGSGATAVTLVPAMAERAAHVTMLQRSPSYVFSLPGSDPLADLLRGVLPPRLAYPLVRWKNVVLASLLYGACRRWPRAMRGFIRRGVAKRLPPGYDVDTHFNPSYDPWDQRLCLVPDGDLFDAISSGKASVATGAIETFTEHGVRLRSGEELEADVIVTATGLNLLMLGGIELSVDGRRIDLGETVGYKGMMLSGVPNLAFTVGYTNASWTLKADLVAGYVCRLLRHMDEHGYTVCAPGAPDPAQPRRPLLDLASGYVLRSLEQLPKQGGEMPWRLHQSYFRDLAMFRRGPLEDEGIAFSRPAPAGVEPHLLAA